MVAENEYKITISAKIKFNNENLTLLSNRKLMSSDGLLLQSV